MSDLDLDVVKKLLQFAEKMDKFQRNFSRRVDALVDGCDERFDKTDTCLNSMDVQAPPNAIFVSVFVPTRHRRRGFESVSEHLNNTSRYM